MNNVTPKESSEMATSPHLNRPRFPSPDIATASLLESLPPAMLDEILCRLPIRDAARTSALSQSWSHRWKSAPYQVLHWPIGTPPYAIYEVLVHRTCPVRAFRHQYVQESDFHLPNLCLDVLAGVGVRSLSVKFPQMHMLDSSIFSCRDLTVLDLEGCDIPGHPPPVLGGLPNLTTLSLSNAGFSLGVRELEALISSSPSLQTLRLQNLRICNEHEQWVIHAPNLQRLLVSSEFDYGWQINNLPAIEVADINWKYYSVGRDFVNLISVLDKARELKLSTPLAMRNMLDGLSRSFVNLKSLSLHIPYCSRYNILAIFYIVRNAHKLEALDIEHDDYPHAIAEADLDSLNVPWTDDMFSSLTSVHLKNVIWNPYEYFLSSLFCPRQGNLKYLVSINLDNVRNLMKTHLQRLHDIRELLLELMLSSAACRRVNSQSLQFVGCW